MPRKESVKNTVDQVRRRAQKPTVIPVEKTIDRNRLIPSGSTLQNLACSDSIYGAFLEGTMVNIIGDSGSGKTLAALEVLAQCALLSRFDEWDFIFDDIEGSNEFDMAKQFGRKVADRLQAPPNGTSNTIEEFKLNVITAIRGERPCIYICDSFDALSDAKELERTEAQLSGKELKGTYGMAKPKMASELFRICVRELKESRSLLIIISQVRENIDPMSFKRFNRNGGKALDFYAIHKMWLGNIGTLREKERTVGHAVRVKNDKNKLNGKEREIDYDIISGYGIDDIGSMVDFMIAEKFWTKKEKDGPKKEEKTIKKGQAKKDKQGVYHTGELGVVGKRETIINFVEENNLQRKLRAMVGDAWKEIEDSIKPNRTAKY